MFLKQTLKTTICKEKTDTFHNIKIKNVSIFKKTTVTKLKRQVSWLKAIGL